jgi:hypothetical protein
MLTTNPLSYGSKLRQTPFADEVRLYCSIFTLSRLNPLDGVFFIPKNPDKQLYLKITKNIF